MKNLMKKIALVILLGLTFLSGSSKNLLIKSANAGEHGGIGGSHGRQGGSCG